MKSSSKGSNSLLEYVTQNDEFDIKELKEILKIPNIEIDASDDKGKTSLHHLVGGCPEYQYSRLLITSGADITIKNHNNETPLCVIITQESQGPLLFLFLLAYHNRKIDIPENLHSNQAVKPIIDLFNFQFVEDSKCGRIFTKLMDSHFNFNDLEKDEIIFLDEMRILNAKHNKYKSSNSSEDSDSDPETEDLVKIFSQLDLGDNLEMINIFRKFIGGFSLQIHKKNNLECSKSLITNSTDDTPIIKALQKYLRSPEELLMEDCEVILETRDNPSNVPQYIHPILNNIDYETITKNITDNRGAEEMPIPNIIQAVADRLCARLGNQIE